MEKRKVPCEVYSRVVGYLRPVQGWHVGKKQEWKDRVNYRVSEVKDASDAIPDQQYGISTTG